MIEHPPAFLPFCSEEGIAVCALFSNQNLCHSLIWLTPYPVFNHFILLVEFHLVIKTSLHTKEMVSDEILPRNSNWELGPKSSTITSLTRYVF